jgi:hypothetical protein
VEQANPKFLNQVVSSHLWIPTQKGLWDLLLNGFQNFKEEEVLNTWSVVESQPGKLLFLNFGNGVQQYDGQQLRTIPKKEYLSVATRVFKPFNRIPAPDLWYFRALRDQKGYCWLPDAMGYTATARLTGILYGHCHTTKNPSPSVLRRILPGRKLSAPAISSFIR